MKMKFFKLAKSLSMGSEHLQHKLGALIVRKNRVVSFGWNKCRTHTKSNSRHSAIHAELDAILRAKDVDLSKCDIYLYRQTKMGKLGNSRPCQFCQALLKKVQIKNAHYTTETGYVTEKFI